MGGGVRMVREAYRVGSVHKVHGNAVANGRHAEHQIVGGMEGFALTFGVPADFWDRWLAQNADSDAVLNGLIFAHGKHGHAEGQAREKAGETRSGFERLSGGKFALGAERFDGKAA
jgi:hypothetical protein